MSDGTADTTPEQVTGDAGIADAVSPRAELFDRRPELLVVAAMAVFVIVFGRLVLLRHNQFRTIDFDLGIHDQSIWLLSRLKSFCTVRGLPVFGHHATFGYILLIPFAWLGAGPNVWNVLQVIALAAGAYPLFHLARMRLENEWLAVVPAIVWLLQPPLIALCYAARSRSGACSASTSIRPPCRLRAFRSG